MMPQCRFFEEITKSRILADVLILSAGRYVSLYRSFSEAVAARGLAVATADTTSGSSTN